MTDQQSLDILTREITVPDQVPITRMHSAAAYASLLQHALDQLTEKNAVIGGLEQAFAAQAEQVKALKAKVAELTAPTDIAEKRAKAG